MLSLIWRDAFGPAIPAQQHHPLKVLGLRWSDFNELTSWEERLRCLLLFYSRETHLEFLIPTSSLRCGPEFWAPPPNPGNRSVLFSSLQCTFSPPDSPTYIFFFFLHPHSSSFWGLSSKHSSEVPRFVLLYIKSGCCKSRGKHFFFFIPAKKPWLFCIKGTSTSKLLSLL